MDYSSHYFDCYNVSFYYLSTNLQSDISELPKTAKLQAVFSPPGIVQLEPLSGIDLPWLAIVIAIVMVVLFYFICPLVISSIVK